MTHGRYAGLVLAGGSGSRFARSAPEGSGPKTLLRDEDDRSLLAHAVETLTGAGCDPVVVVVGAHAEAVTAEVEAVATRLAAGAGDGAREGDGARAGAGARVVAVPCPDWAEGMGASLREGLAALVGGPASHGALPGAIPDVTGGDTCVREDDDAPDIAANVPDPSGADDTAEGVPGDGTRLPAADDAGAPRTTATAGDDVADLDGVVVTLADLPDQSVDVARRVLDAVPAGSSGRAVFGGRPGHPVVLGPDVWADVLAGVGGDVGAREVLRARDAVTVECGDLASGGDVDRPTDLAGTQRTWGAGA